MKKEEKFLKTGDLISINTICNDFSSYLLSRENVTKELTDNPNFQSGLQFGIKSALILFNDFLIRNDGYVDKAIVEKILEGIKNKNKDKDIGPL